MPDRHVGFAATRNWCIATLVMLLILAPKQAQEQEPNLTRRAPFQFAAIGDQGYDPTSEARFPGLMREIEEAEVEFIVHVGDIKAGTTPCTDELLRRRLEEFDASAHPFIYTPGDNEWTDCRVPQTPDHPLERLAQLRATFFPARASLGRRRIPLVRQNSDETYETYVENSYWIHNNVLFVMIHIVGSNNNRHMPSEDNTEYQQRTAANIAWLKKTFGSASELGLSAVVVMTQANPQFELIDQPGDSSRPNGFAETLRVLRELTLSFAKPVLLIHGDTHTFRIDKPLVDTEKRAIENFTRLEVFGYPYSHWVRIGVDPRDAQPFSFAPQIVPSNVFPR